MIAKLIDWIRSKMGWKEWLIVAGVFILLAGVGTLIWWVMLGGALCMGPKLLEETSKRLTAVDRKLQKKEDEIEEKKEVKLEQIRKEETATKAIEALQEAAREEANKELPKEKTADELVDLILDDIDKAGRE